MSRAVARFVRAGGRETEGDAPHLLEGIAVVAFDRETGVIEPDLPPVRAAFGGMSSSTAWPMPMSPASVRREVEGEAYVGLH